METRLTDTRQSAAAPSTNSASRPSRLPIELTSFVGREQEISAVRERLATTRLLTLTGAAGTGKTRLGLEIAAREAPTYEGEVAWVELASVAQASLVAATALTAIGGAERPGRSAVDALVAALRDRRSLLVLDNCEHLIDACASLADTLLRSCPELRIIATSREALGIGGEVAWLVPPLSVPDPRLPLEESEAVQLFVERARAVAPRFTLDPPTSAAVAKICRRLDGLPLALELAAARLRALAVEQVAERLDDRFRLLVGGSRTALPRHQTLRAAIHWSYELLTERERWLLDHLAIFSGSFTLEAAEAVCASDEVTEGEVLDLVASLVEKSLVVLLDSEDAARYRLLESVRQFAAEHLATRGDATVYRDRHAAHYTALAQEAEPHLIGLQRRAWSARLLRDVDNVRSAIEWSGERDPVLSLRLAGSLCWFWYSAGLWTEGCERIALALAHPSAKADTPERANALFAIGALAALQGRPEVSLPQLEECVVLARAQGNERLEAYAQNYIGMTYGQRADPRTVAPTEAALSWARRAGDLYASRLALLILGVYWWQMRDYQRARTAMEEGTMVARQYGQDRELGIALSCLARLEIDLGHTQRGGALARESLRAFTRDPQHLFVARSLEIVAGLACRAGAVHDGVRLLGAAEAVRESVGSRRYPADAAWVDEHVAAAKSRLSAEQYDSAWQSGRRTSLDAAIALAVGDASLAIEDLAFAQAQRDFAAPPNGGAGDAHASTRQAINAKPGQSVRADHGTRLRVRSLGTLQVERAGAALSPAAWTYAKPRELLLFLLSHPEGSSREQVGLALWPDASAAQVRNNFHVTVHHLRKALGGAEWVTVERGRYRILSEQDVEFDAVRFEALATAAVQRARRGAPSTDELRAALALYGGDFAASESFGDWHLELRDRLHRLYVDTRLALADAHSAAGLHADAVDLLEAACREDPLDESAVRRLMIALARMGEHSAAVTRYQRLRDALHHELNTSPGRESLLLLERIQRGEKV